MMCVGVLTWGGKLGIAELPTLSSSAISRYRIHSRSQLVNETSFCMRISTKFQALGPSLVVGFS